MELMTPLRLLESLEARAKGRYRKYLTYCYAQDTSCSESYVSWHLTKFKLGRPLNSVQLSTVGLARAHGLLHLECPVLRKISHHKTCVIQSPGPSTNLSVLESGSENRIVYSTNGDIAEK